MFWKFATTSNVDNLLEKEDVTLQELMDDDDVLQECKGQSTKLIEFLCKPEVMDELVQLIITEPSGNIQDPVKYKYSNLACEILVSDVAQMNDVLGETESLREKLFSFLDNPSPLNPLLASFFSKVVGILLSRKPEPTLEYIKGKDDFLGCVLRHLGTSAIMDLLLRLVTCVEALDLRAQVLNWLNENHLVERLICLIDPSSSEDFHCNSAQSLCDIIRLSREHMYTMQESAQDDPLLNTLERKETVELLLQHMFDNGINESVIINGIMVLLALLEIRRPAPFGFPEMAPELTQLDVERLACGVSKTLHGLSDRLSDFHKLLESPPKKEIMNCTFGELDPPLGNTRLHVGKLLSAILITNTHNMNVQLSELQIFNILLDLFFRYEYNNFLHTQVVQCVQTVLANAVTVTTQDAPAPLYAAGSQEAANQQQRKEDEDAENPRKVAPLLTHLFEDCRVIQRILDAWEDNRIQEATPGGHRKGNMGHLTLITNQIIENMDKGSNAERIKQFIEGMPEEDQGRWQKFVAESLAEINEMNCRELGGHNPMHFSSDDDGETDYSQFTTCSAQQAFTDYQLQQITSNFIDQFGFTDADFAEQEEPDKFNKLSSVDFDIKAGTNTDSQVMFENVCKARFPNIGDSSDEEDNGNDIFEHVDDDEWDNANFKYGSASTTTPNVTVRPRSSSTDSNDSSGDEDGGGGPLSIAQTPTPQQPSKVEDMDTTSAPRHAWQDAFDADDDASSSSDSSSSHSTPTTSPRVDLNNASATVTGQLWADAKPDSDNWANFDNFENLQVERSADASPTSLPSRASKYAVADSTSVPAVSTAPSDLDNKALSPIPPSDDLSTSEDMDVVTDQQTASARPVLVSPASSPIVVPTQTAASSDDVIMQVLDDDERADEKEDDVFATDDDANVITSSSSWSRAVQMETDVDDGDQRHRAAATSSSHQEAAAEIAATAHLLPASLAKVSSGDDSNNVVTTSSSQADSQSEQVASSSPPDVASSPPKVSSSPLGAAASPPRVASSPPGGETASPVNVSPSPARVEEGAEEAVVSSSDPPSSDAASAQLSEAAVSGPTDAEVFVANVRNAAADDQRSPATSTSASSDRAARDADGSGGESHGAAPMLMTAASKPIFDASVQNNEVSSSSTPGAGDDAAVKVNGPA